jgi:hypothetical protein
MPSEKRYLCEISRIGKFIETQGRLVVIRDRKRRKREVNA